MYSYHEREMIGWKEMLISEPYIMHADASNIGTVPHIKCDSSHWYGALQHQLGTVKYTMPIHSHR